MWRPVETALRESLFDGLVSHFKFTSQYTKNLQSGVDTETERQREKEH